MIIKPRKRIKGRVKEPLEQPANFTETWSVDFMSDALSKGRKIRSFHVIDNYNSEILFVEQDYSLTSRGILWIFRHLIARYGKPKKIRMDNGPEFIAKIAKAWGETQDIEFKYIQPGKPTQNAYIERFNRSFRNGVLDAHIFESLEELREITEKWVKDYNEERPHESLGNISPIMYKLKHQNRDITALRFASATPSLHSAL
ncbi:MAG: transposase [Luteibaculaceae bacterium]